MSEKKVKYKKYKDKCMNTSGLCDVIKQVNMSQKNSFFKNILDVQLRPSRHTDNSLSISILAEIYRFLKILSNIHLLKFGITSQWRLEKPNHYYHLILLISYGFYLKIHNVHYMILPVFTSFICFYLFLICFYLYIPTNHY